MRNRFLLSLTLLIGATIAVACDASPTVVTRKQLSFLEQQQKPLLKEEVGRCLGTTIQPNVGTWEPVHRYTRAEDEATIDFWILDFPVERLREMKPDELVPVEISMVVEIPVGAKPRIIWPRDLIGADINAVLRETWPKIYNTEDAPRLYKPSGTDANKTGKGEK